MANDSAAVAEQRVKAVYSDAYALEDRNALDDEFSWSIVRVYGEPIGWGETESEAWLYADSNLPAFDEAQTEPARAEVDWRAIAKSTAREICTLFNVSTRRGDKHLFNSPEQTIAIIIQQRYQEAVHADTQR